MNELQLHHDLIDRYPGYAIRVMLNAHAEKLKHTLVDRSIASHRTVSSRRYQPAPTSS
ncbi:hypothetical protein [Neolewinella litorea]|uniref:hypothetical protein n=1 Tax=Neolewinella litorea TaxID=2562452 RepID=UPI00145610C7|nr:hypothetical protein [Neolewinella litorea]